MNLKENLLTVLPLTTIPMQENLVHYLFVGLGKKEELTVEKQ